MEKEEFTQTVRAIEQRVINSREIGIGLCKYILDFMGDDVYRQFRGLMKPKYFPNFPYIHEEILDNFRDPSYKREIFLISKISRVMCLREWESICLKNKEYSYFPTPLKLNEKMELR